jgi:hypothetical protein
MSDTASACPAPADIGDAQRALLRELGRAALIASVAALGAYATCVTIITEARPDLRREASPRAGELVGAKHRAAAQSVAGLTVDWTVRRLDERLAAGRVPLLRGAAAVWRGLAECWQEDFALGPMPGLEEIAAGMLDDLSFLPAVCATEPPGALVASWRASFRERMAAASAAA